MSGFFSSIVNWFKNIFGGTQEITEEQPQVQNTVYLPDEGAKRHSPKRKGGNDDASSSRRTAQGSVPPQQKQDTRTQKQTSANPKKPKPARGSSNNAPSKSMEGWVPPEPVRQADDEHFFQEFGLDNRILRALLEELGFRRCSPIQAQALPHSLQGKDLAGKAQTGTGKTAAFLITVLQRFLNTNKEDRDPWQPMAIILAPTRELAIQIATDAANISAYCPEFSTVAVYGGMDYDKQLSALSHGVDLVVATPGRLIDYLHKHAVDLGKVDIAVIDEADRMLDMGFIPDVKRIMAYLPPSEKRQTMLFSATLTGEIMTLASRWMRPNPVVVEIEPEHILAEGIDETVYAATTNEKMAIMLWLFKHEDCHRVLIFRNRKKDVESLHALLQRCGVQCEMLTGDVDQKKRLRILDDFKDGKVKIIVATDVAGRGIHVDDVTHVINYDLPYEAEDYVHRVGRTARAGHKGRAISFADEDCGFVIPEIEKVIERPLPITQPTDEMLEMPPNLRNLGTARSTGSHRHDYGDNHSSYGRSGFSRRPSGPRIRRSGPRK
ncbi:MAG: DEAD/DEAH box helicase [Victivallales bacterium]|nr:DEAD/DEAH box helicase [Victivallales bacterium]